MSDTSKTTGNFNTMAVKGEATPLLAAIKKGDVDIDAQDKFGHTFLISAISWRRYDLAKALIEMGADVTLKTHDMETALTLVARQGDFTVGKLLIDNGADIHAQNRKVKDTALHYTALFGHPQLMSYLIDHGANVNQQNYSGQTPLHMVLNIRAKSDDLHALTSILTTQPINPDLQAFDKRTVTDVAAVLSSDIQDLVKKGIANYHQRKHKKRAENLVNMVGKQRKISMKRRK